MAGRGGLVEAGGFSRGTAVLKAVVRQSALRHARTLQGEAGLGWAAGPRPGRRGVCVSVCALRQAGPRAREVATPAGLCGWWEEGGGAAVFGVPPVRRERGDLCAKELIKTETVQSCR